MMKFKKLLYILLIPSMLSLIIVPGVHSNPIVVGPSLKGFFYICVILPIIFTITIFIEFGIIYFFLRKNITRNSKLTKAVLSVNLLTFPITQMIAFSFMMLFSDLNNFYFITELIPITLEFLIYLKIFKNFYYFKYFRSPVSTKTTFLSIITANLMTFAFGITISLSQINTFI